VPATREYLDTVIQELEKLRLRGGAKDFDDAIVESIANFTPYRNELIELFAVVASYKCDDDMLQVVHSFFEKMISFFENREAGGHTNLDFDNYKFIGHELFLYCLGALFKHSRYYAVESFLNNEYYIGDNPYSLRRDPMVSFLVFRNYLPSLEARKTRLNLNRLSLRADMLKERCQGTGVDFRQLMTVDLILYLRSQVGDSDLIWWPETLLYASDHGVTFEIFARAKSAAYFDKIKGLLGVRNKEDLAQLIEKIELDGQRRIPHWQFQSINPRRLIQLDAIATAV
jgi:hypothetical protein